jgi:predicted metalloprotease
MRGLVVVYLLASALAAQTDSKVELGSRFLLRAWKEFFAANELTFEAPKVVAFTKESKSACGKLIAGNAYYCERDHTVYYDSEFLEALRQRAASASGSTGDAAPLVAIAHEMGHAVYAKANSLPEKRPPFQRLNGYGEEKVADCMAGIFTRAAVGAGILAESARKDGADTIAFIGSQGLGVPFSFRKDDAHPNWRIRRGRFLAGYDNGLRSCIANLVEPLSK